jgi:Tfp pilus assembly protein PilW
MRIFRILVRGCRVPLRKSSIRGMTLIEIGLLELYMAGQKYFFNQDSRANTIEESRVPMTRISRDIRDASSVADGPVTAFDGQDYTTGGTCLVLEVPSIDGTGMAISGSTDYIIYTYDATNMRLVRIISVNAGVRENRVVNVADNLVDDGQGGSPFKLKYFWSDGSTEVTSSYGDPDNGAFIVEVELTAQGRSIQRTGQNFVETVRTQATLRNKVVPG